jgi:hypothetical protein
VLAALVLAFSVDSRRCDWQAAVASATKAQARPRSVTVGSLSSSEYSAPKTVAAALVRSVVTIYMPPSTRAIQLLRSPPLSHFSRIAFVFLLQSTDHTVEASRSGTESS